MVKSVSLLTLPVSSLFVVNVPGENWSTRLGKPPRVEYVQERPCIIRISGMRVTDNQHGDNQSKQGWRQFKLCRDGYIYAKKRSYKNRYVFHLNNC